jgi:drug/metabolite transporter (DMT)-like permease
MKTNRAYFKYIAALLLFGSNGIVASHISLNSYEIVFSRTLIGSVFLVLIFIFSNQKVQIGKNKAHIIYLVISGVAMGASWMSLYEAYQQIGVSLATLAYYCGPVFVMVLSPILFKEKMTWVKLLGFLAVLTGLLCVYGKALAEGKFSWGLIYGILAAVMYAFMVIFNKKAVSITGLENPMWQLIISFITVAIFLTLKQGLSIRIGPGNLLPILLLGLVNTGVGCYFYFSSIGDLPVQTVAIIGYLEPLSALVFSALLLGETLSLLQIAGAGLILGGAAFGELFHR